MILNRATLAIVLAAGLAATASAAEPPGCKSQDQTTERLQPCNSMFSRLVGEWEGQIQTRNSDGRVSTSMASVSNRLENNDKSLVSCFEGFAFGRPVHGASVIRMNPGAQAERSWYTNLTNATMTMPMKASSSENSIAFAGEGVDPSTGKTVSIEQVLRVVDSNNYVFESFSIESSGEKVMLMRLEMSRLPEGRLAQAAEKFSDAKLLAKVRLNSPAQTADANGH
ncbi:MAG: DUF1579 family protein [Phycisphaeraceae bacterium]|nr:DUF1579 family protein [Phycisphaeraceae bacterium]